MSGPADHTRWVDEFKSLLLMQDATVTHSRVTPEHAMHQAKTAEELLQYYRYDSAGGYYERQIQGMVQAGWS